MKIRFFIKKIYHKLKVYTEFFLEARYFCKYYTFASNNQSNLEYKMLIIAHSIEKGLCVEKNVRPFGSKKVQELIDALRVYSSKGYSESFAFQLSLSMLDEYKKFYETNKFTNESIYKVVSNVLDEFEGYQKLECGKEQYKTKNINCNYLELLNSRHSIRSFSDKKISMDEINYAIDCAIKSPSACNRQMIKAYCYFNKNKEQIDIVNNFAQGLSGFDKKNINYFVITYNESAFCFPGERNQGLFNAGLFSTNLINGLHNKGIGSCFIQYANSLSEEKKMKKELGIPENERIAVLVAFGKYNDEYMIPRSTRKNKKDILKMVENE